MSLKNYVENGGPPSFQVRHRFFKPEEGGLRNPPRMYAGDDPLRDGLWMIHPAFS